MKHVIPQIKADAATLNKVLLRTRSAAHKDKRRQSRQQAKSQLRREW